jgi:DNA-binding transcriptional ArsR family regulator
VLSVLSSPSRLAILSRLREPKTPSQVEVPASMPRGDLAEGRPLSRSAVYQHLQVLEELGVVRKIDGSDAYVLD